MGVENSAGQHYFVAVLSLAYTPILPTFFKNKKRNQNKKT